MILASFSIEEQAEAEAEAAMGAEVEVDGSTWFAVDVFGL